MDRQDRRLREARFILADPDHTLDWQYNKDGRKFALVISSPEGLPRIKGTEGLDVESWKKTDGTFHIAFVLKDDKYADQFESFCKDAIESSRGLDPADGAAFALGRYKRWMRMFKPRSGHLNDASSEGLIGEMLALRDVLMERHGESQAVGSWANRKFGKQDFVLGGTWYEVKAVTDGKRTVRITSLEQLDRNEPGRMIVVSLRRTTAESSARINLNILSDDLLGRIRSLGSKNEFVEILAEAGYQDDPYYDGVNYELVGIDEYAVGEGFPRLRRSQIMPGIVSGEYDISLDKISEYKVVRRWTSRSSGRTA